MTATAGEAWLGPMGLLGRLELELGLGGAWPSPATRRCHLASILASSGGGEEWWRASFEVDPIGACTQLLRDRDTLVEWGWRGQPVSPRLTGLWAATAPALPGKADRLRWVTEALATRAVDVAQVAVMSPVDSLSPAWRDLFAALAAQGVTIDQVLLPVVKAPGDLGAARESMKSTARRGPSQKPRGTGATNRAFGPSGDGRLTLLRPHGPLAAADEVAASLAAMRSLVRPAGHGREVGARPGRAPAHTPTLDRRGGYAAAPPRPDRRGGGRPPGAATAV